AILPCGVDCVGAQFVRATGGGAVWGGGVVGVGGACANAADAAINTQPNKTNFRGIQGNAFRASRFPRSAAKYPAAGQRGF
ncbi:MAG TPA: hypothetical protein VFQ87_14770, partial [Bradyrhizobium sp.]|nr:hypothetical protein [Bradyrhizobium sp.]